MKKSFRLLSSITIVAIILSLFQPIAGIQAAMPQTPSWNYGDVVDTRQSDLGFGATYTWLDMNVDNAIQKVHTVEFDPTNPNLSLVGATKNGYVSGMKPLTGMSSEVDSEGSRVIAGINGDFYEISGHATGVPNGIFMTDGEILISPSSSYAFGLTADGQSVYGNVSMTKKIVIDGTTTNLTSVNRFRDNNQLVLFTNKYGTSTGASSQGVEVVLDVVSGNVSSGSTLEMTVAEVLVGKGNTALTEGKVVLSASGDKTAILESLQVGQVVTASFELNEPFQNIVFAIGGSGPLVDQGEAKSVSPEGIHPRTAIGTKADGSIVFFEVDGRQPGFSEGLETEQVAKLMVEMGVVQAMNLDGGGSSTLIAKLSGESTAKMMNSGSDGYERSTGNGILLVNTAPELGEASSIVVTPSVERVLVGSTFSFTASGLDENYHNASLVDPITWSVDEAYGTINEDGTFVAGEQAGEVTITASSGSVTGEATIEIVDSLTALKFPDEEKTYTSGEVVALSVTALRNGQVVQASNNDFTWSVSGDIGVIDENGVFTATEASGENGTITVAFGDVTTSFNVNVGLPPVLLEDFENGLENYVAGSDRVVSVSINEVTDQDFVRNGKASLKLSYDFTDMPSTSGAYLKSKDASTYTEIPGYPEKIGMWVYGDGKGHWLRAQLRDGDNKAFAVDFTDQTNGVNWVGWKYVEAKIPEGKKMPLKMDMQARYMETSIAKKDTGAIYIDDISAVYGPITDADYDAPEIVSFSPQENAMLSTATPTIKITAQDAGYDAALNPGTTLIDPDKIRLYIDGNLVQHGLYPPKGEISYVPTEPLSEGNHTVKIAVRDLSGNQTIKEWTFKVNLGSPYYEYSIDETVLTGQTYTFDITAQSADKLTGSEIELSYTPDAIRNLTFVPNAKIDENKVEFVADEAAGKLSLKLTDISTANLSAIEKLGSIQYEVDSSYVGPYSLTQIAANPQTTMQFKVTKGQVYTENNSDINYNGESYSVIVDAKYELTWDHYATAIGEPAVFTVVDKLTHAPVEGVQLMFSASDADPSSFVTAISDMDGKIVTPDLTTAAGTLNVQAVKEQLFSPIMSFVVAPSAGTNTPKHINITVGGDTTSTRNITWKTSPEVKDTFVELVNSSEFTNFADSNVQKIEGSSYLYTTASDGTVRIHQVELTGLDSGQQYVYRVGNGADLVSSQGTFKTTAEDQESAKFLFFGDSQAADEAGFNLWGQVVDKAVEQSPLSNVDMIIHAGDMVDSGYDFKQWDWWFKAAETELMNSTLVPIIGNHEVYGNNGTGNYLAQFNNVDNGLAINNGTSFSYDVADTHIVVLNTEMGEEGIKEQVAWLSDDLASNEKKWTIVVFHQGPYGSTYENKLVQQYWVPVFDQYGVDLVMNGHDHIYLRTFNMNGGNIVDDDKPGTTYMIGGSSGPKFYGLTPYYWQNVVYDTQTQIYSEVTTDDEGIHVTVRNVNGETVDSFTLTEKAGDDGGTVTPSPEPSPEVTPEPSPEVSPEPSPEVSPEPSPEVSPEPTAKPTPAPTPVVTPGTTSEPTPTPNVNVLEVTAQQLASPSNGTIVIQAGAQVSQIQLPRNVESLLSGVTLVVESPNWAFELDSDTYAEWSKQADQASTLINVQVINKQADVTSIANLASEVHHANITAIGQAFQVVVSANGKQISTENDIVSLAIPLAEKDKKATVGLYEVKEDGTLVYVPSKLVDNKLVANVNANSTYVVMDFDKEFSDVASEYWANAMIKELVAKGIIQGISDTEFAPTKEVTRAEFTTMLVRMLGLPEGSTASFTDVKKGSWYESAILAAVKAGIVTGKSEQLFDPNGNISREEMAVMIARAVKYVTGSELELVDTPFGDMTEASSWAIDAIEKVYGAGIISGKTLQSFDPSGLGTRAESAKMMLLVYHLIHSVE